jgi:hypothetical protein
MITRYFEPVGEMPKVEYKGDVLKNIVVHNNGWIYADKTSTDFPIATDLKHCTIHLHALEDWREAIPEEVYWDLTIDFVDDLDEKFGDRKQSTNDLLFKYNIDADNYIEKGLAVKV